MKLKLSLPLLILVAISIKLHAANSSTPAPLPNLMDQQQLAQWKAHFEKAAITSQEIPTQFYTGKPFSADAGGYIFKYRTYNPEMARWTSEDPSGFPDGANNRFYAPSPTSEMDPYGLSLTFASGSSGTPSPPTASDITSGGTTFKSITYTMTIVPITSSNQGAIVSGLQSQLR